MAHKRTPPRPRPALSRAAKIARDMDRELKSKGISATISTGDGKSAHFGAERTE